MSSALRVLFLAAEVDPYFKVGGLDDVAGSLPPVLRHMGVDLRLVLPLHGGIRFLFEEATPVKLMKTLVRAIHVYQHQAIWQALQLWGMRRDFSRERSAHEYLRLYQEVNYVREKRPVEV
jgi:glycogen synthase